MTSISGAYRPSVALADVPVPPGIVHPPAVWIYNVAIPVLGTVLLLAAIAQCLQRGRLTWSFLFLVNSMLVFWMETMGDWGQHLIYSPALSHHHLLDWLPVKTPNDPIFMPFAYGVYWTVHAAALLWLADRLRRRNGWSLLKGVVVLSVPVNVVWDLSVEATSAYFGWWTYDPGFGPVIHFAHGNQPLLWPILLMVGWPNLVAYWGGKPENRGLNLIERRFGLGRWTAPRVPAARAVTEGALLVREAAVVGEKDYDVTIALWKFELARFGAWFAVFQASFFLTLVVPLVLLRVLTGHDSAYVP